MKDKECKVKLVAIAKDEAAYLSEWIFHHLYFGFDQIEIYVNNTSDNTDELEQALSKEPKVTFLSGDSYFGKEDKKPQEAIYQDALIKARKEEFSHILFLDIDEFWTPRDFSKNIKDCISKIDSDVISFEWFCKHAEDELFMPAFDFVNYGKRLRFVKSIIKIDNNNEIKVGVHNSQIKGASYRLADGRDFIFNSNFNSKVPKIKFPKKIQPFFIYHRMYRSQVEYVSLLGRGRPKSINGPFSFKNNRNGYGADAPGVTFKIEREKIERYQKHRQEFHLEYNINPIIEKARDFITKRYNDVLLQIENSEKKDKDVIKKIFNKVTLPDVKEKILKIKNK